MAYEQRWYSGNPGCLIVLLDQSGSMDEVVVGDKLGRRKCDLAAEIVNQTLSRLVDENTTMDSGVKDRAEVAVIGYGGSGVSSALGGFLTGQDIVSLSELAANIVRTEQQEVHGVDSRGEPIVTVVDHLVWVEPSAAGGTPMGEAFRKAHSLVEVWARAHPTSHPPVVINISDGGATDCGNSRDFTPYARQLVEVTTDDGNALLLNIHITEKQTTPIEYPAQIPDLGDVARDPVTVMLAKYLFDTASILPDVVLNRMQAEGTKIEAGARGFVFNGNGPSLTQMFVFVTPRPTGDIPMDR
jgi:uncharacterized protein YegL